MWRWMMRLMARVRKLFVGMISYQLSSKRQLGLLTTLQQPPCGHVEAHCAGCEGIKGALIIWKQLV